MATVQVITTTDALDAARGQLVAAMGLAGVLLVAAATLGGPASVLVAALRTLRPDQLQFLISDRGPLVTAHPFALVASGAPVAPEEDGVPVLIARHRPESNGIAARFVRTLKEWLAERAWDGVETLALLRAQFRVDYHARPHQGLALPGLSPPEFAARFWLL